MLGTSAATKRPAYNCFNGTVGDLCVAGVSDKSSGIGGAGDDRSADGDVVDAAAGHLTDEGAE